MTLTTNLVRLVEYAEESDDYDEHAFDPLVHQVEQASWRKKDKNGSLPIALPRLMALGSVEFALWALGAAEQEEEANRIGVQMCLSVAATALDRVVGEAVDSVKRELGQWRAQFAGAKSCMAVREWVASRWNTARTLHSGGSLYAERAYNVHHLAIHAFSAGVFCAADSDAEFMAGWRRAPATIIPAAVDVLKLMDPVYEASRRIADAAERAQDRWQAGTRLHFNFLEDVRESLDETEDVAERGALPLARGWAEAAWAEYVGAQ